MESLDTITNEEIIDDTLKVSSKGKKNIVQWASNELSDFENGSYLEAALEHRGFITNENWDSHLHIDARVVRVKDEEVICECLIDKESRLFEVRSFHKSLFSKKWNNGSFIRIIIKTKVGSSRIDIINGDRLVDKFAFNLKEEWDNLSSEDFGTKLDGPISL